jgi:hypothetical protein
MERFFISASVKFIVFLRSGILIAAVFISESIIAAAINILNHVDAQGKGLITIDGGEMPLT